MYYKLKVKLGELLFDIGLLTSLDDLVSEKKVRYTWFWRRPAMIVQSATWTTKTIKIHSTTSPTGGSLKVLILRVVVDSDMYELQAGRAEPIVGLRGVWPYFLPSKDGETESHEGPYVLQGHTEYDQQLPSITDAGCFLRMISDVNTIPNWEDGITCIVGARVDMCRFEEIRRARIPVERPTFLYRPIRPVKHQ